MDKFKRQNDESEVAYIWRICSYKDEIGTWQDVCNLLNKELGHNYGESWYRKEYQGFERVFNSIKEQFLDDEYLKTLDDKIHELEKQRIKLRDERTHHNREVRKEARLEVKLDLLEEKIHEVELENYPVTSRIRIASDNDLLIMFSDLHIGQTFNSMWGTYNSKIAQDRVNEYLQKIIEIQKIHNAQNAYVSLQGDMISNSIHKTIAITNTENVIEQIILASKIISSFLYELSKHFQNVYVIDVAGNHSRLDRKEDALKDERLDSLITWYAKSALSHINNILFMANLDITLTSFSIRGYYYLCVHGDYDKFDANSVNKLIAMVGYVPYCVLFAHKHFPASTEVNGVKLVQCGSFAGCGDDHTIELRLCGGKPSQTILVCNDEGIVCNYTIELS